MKNYNYDLAKKIINTFVDLDVIDSAALGMQEDWFWTACTIYEDGKWQIELMSSKDAEEMHNEYLEKTKEGLRMFIGNDILKPNPEYEKYEACKIGGLFGSDFAMPVLEVIFKNGDRKVFNCYTGSSEVDILESIERSFQLTSGVLSKPIQEARVNIEVEDFKITE